MATTTIPWGDGSGDNIYLDYSASVGDQTVLVSSDPNAGPARTKDITFVSTVGNISRTLTVLQESGMDYVSITWNDTCITFNDTAIAYPYEEPYIVFVDPVVEQICATNWGDGTGIKPSQAAQVTNLNQAFRNNTNISSFDELIYFTGLTTLSGSNIGQFEGCTALESIAVPQIGNWEDNYREIERAFRGCSSLTTLTWHCIVNHTANTSQIQTYTFNECSSLTRVNILSIEAWMKNLWGVEDARFIRGPFDASHDGHLYLNNIEVTSLDIPSTITIIYPGACKYCVGLTSVTIPSSVTSIGAYAFADCTGITSISIPPSVTSIGDYAFARCSNLSGSISLNCAPGVGSFNATPKISNLTINTDAYSTMFATGSTVSNVSGDGTGVFTINGSYTVSSTVLTNYREVNVSGDVSGSPIVRNVILNSTYSTEIIKIGGNYTGTATTAASSSIIMSNGYAWSGTATFSFLEIMGTVTSNNGFAIIDTSDYIVNGFIIHLGFDAYTNNAVPCAPSILNVGWAKVSKIYVGKGDSAAEDNNILSVYTADADWSAYTAKLDTWYNYVNDPNANQDYIN